MADFSIEGDITPLRGRHFSSTLTSGEVSSLEAEEMAGTMNYFNNMSKVIKAMDDKRNRDLQYQMDLERLQRSREDAQRRRDEEARLGDLGKILQGMEGGTAEEQKGYLADLRLNNPSMFSTRGASALYDAAINKINAGENIRAKEEAKAKAEAARLASLYPDPEKLRKKYEADGVIDQFEQQAIEEVTVLQGRAQTEAEKQWNLKNLQSQKKQLEDVESVLTGVKDQGDEIPVGAKTEGGKFKPQDRRKLEFSLLQMGRGQLKMEDIRKMDDDTLYDSALGEYQKGLQEYEAYRQQFSPVRGNTTNTPNTGQSQFLKGVPR